MKYGRVTGLNIIIDMIVDDGNESRSNRHNIMNPANKILGIYSGPIRSTEGHQSCLTFADDYVDNVYDKDTKLTAEQYTAIDTKVFEELNKLRANPKSFVPILESYLPYFTDKTYKAPGKFAVETTEGSKPL